MHKALQPVAAQALKKAGQTTRCGVGHVGEQHLSQGLRLTGAQAEARAYLSYQVVQHVLTPLNSWGAATLAAWRIEAV
ncbi:hypothetical protein SDC9_107443 [bioreactor metagenome]|uniref:Uncharacterized protein n=1 Tax=bioreactor metagenome TaxID=1076179 RepID=A0A645B7K5_9ZZZZ